MLICLQKENTKILATTNECQMEYSQSLDHRCVKLGWVKGGTSLKELLKLYFSCTLGPVFIENMEDLVNQSTFIYDEDPSRCGIEGRRLILVEMQAIY